MDTGDLPWGSQRIGRAKDVVAELGFLSRLPSYETIKPYGLRYQPDADFSQTNIVGEKVQVLVKDAAADEQAFDARGFCLIHCPTLMEYPDFEDPIMIKSIYAREIANTVKSALGAQHVYVMDFSVRRRDPSFPVSTGHDFEHTQPASIAHVDFTPDEAVRMIQSLYGTRNGEALCCPWAIVNVWRPLKYPVVDWPLALCDPQTVDWEKDSMAADVVYPDWLSENQLIHHNASQTWYYFPGQTPDEILLFKGVDSEKRNRAGTQPLSSAFRTKTNECGSPSLACPHVAFANPLCGENEPVRESIDCRVLVFFGQLKEFPPEIGNLYGSKEL